MGRMKSLPRSLAVVVIAVAAAAPVLAGEADVVEATLTPEDGGTYSASVAVRHADTGWDHYANAWQVVAPDGTVLATRELLHPHVGEQPFTRSLSGIEIPRGIETVTIRAVDSVHGSGGAAIEVDVPAD